MSIIRVVKKYRERFLLSDAEIHLRKDVSWGAKGMHAYLMTKPPDWEIRTDNLMSATPAGRASTQRIINELKDAGYMRRYVDNNKETGLLENITEFYETVELNPIYGGTETPEGELSGDQETRSPEKPTAVKPGHIVSKKKKKDIYSDDVIKYHEHDSESIPGAYTEPSFEQINEMVSILSGVCKGVVNVFQPEDCEFYKAAIILIEQDIGAEAIRAFGLWWEKNGYYQGKPAVKSLLTEIGNSIKGIKIDQLNNYAAQKSWKECTQWITRDIKVCDFQDPLTLLVVQQIGESTMRQLSKDNSRQIKTLYFDLYGDLIKQNGA